MLNLDYREGCLEVSNEEGDCSVLITTDNDRRLIITFEKGADCSGMTPFAFAWEEGEIDYSCKEKFSLVVRRDG